MMEIQPFACGVGREQQPHRAAGELPQGVRPLSGREATVQPHARDAGHCRGHVLERVAVFGEDDCRFVRPGQEAPQRGELAFGARGVTGKGEDPTEVTSLLRRIGQSRGLEL